MQTAAGCRPGSDWFNITDDHLNVHTLPFYSPPPFFKNVFKICVFFLEKNKKNFLSSQTVVTHRGCAESPKGVQYYGETPIFRLTFCGNTHVSISCIRIFHQPLPSVGSNRNLRVRMFRGSSKFMHRRSYLTVRYINQEPVA